MSSWSIDLFYPRFLLKIVFNCLIQNRYSISHLTVRYTIVIHIIHVIHVLDRNSLGVCISSYKRQRQRTLILVLAKTCFKRVISRPRSRSRSISSFTVKLANKRCHRVIKRRLLLFFPTSTFIIFIGPKVCSIQLRRSY